MKKMTPMKSIRAKCLDCCLGNRAEVKSCPDSDCALWPYKSGHRPGKKAPKIDSTTEKGHVGGGLDEAPAENVK